MRRYTGVLLNEIAVITSGSTVYLYVSKYVDLFIRDLKKDMVKQATIDFYQHVFIRQSKMSCHLEILEYKK